MASMPLQLKPMVPAVDPTGMLEFSVVYTDRSLNHMSKTFQQVMRDIDSKLKEVYHASTTVLVPGSGSYGMEAVARQFLNGGKKCIVLRQGWFSYRWTQINEACKLTENMTVLKARRDGLKGQFQPAPIDEVIATIKAEKPDVVCTPHVETSAGVMLPDEYLAAVARAAHEVGAIFVLDCIASGCMWVDMASLGVDVLISAPQKGWSSTPCAGIVMLGPLGVERLEATASNSFIIDLKQWDRVMKAYQQGSHMYHSTMPTDGLKAFRDSILENELFGFDKLKAAQADLGEKCLVALQQRGYKSVAAPGFQAPGVIVCYTDDDDVKSGKKFAASNVQIAAGVPLACDEGPDFKSFRLGLFGLEKLSNIDHTVALLSKALDGITSNL